MIFETVYTVRIVYKSGHVQDFECTEFRIKDGAYTWAAVSQQCKPILMGIDEIAAVWQVGSRRRFKW